MTLLYWSLILVMLVGVLGAVLPGIPGAILIVGAIVVWGFANSFAGVWIPLAIAVVVLLANLGVDFLATYWGAKQAGASQWGQIGAIVGLIVGFLGLLPALPIGGPVLGLLLGAFLGAVIGELLYQRDLGLALKAGVGILVGTVVGKLVQGLLAVVPVITFLLTTWSQVY